MGLGVEPDLDGKGVLLQACAQCHNDRLDQNLSRARFNTDLENLDRVEKDRAITRLRIPAGEPSAMPPAGFRELSDQARDRLIELLKR
jgi:mono/diheme cytochrome c family protein